MRVPEKQTQPLLKPPFLLQHCLRLRGRPSPPGEGDRDQIRSDLGYAARSLSFFLFLVIFVFILASRSDGSEPPPPFSSSTFLFTSPSSDLVFQGEDLLESLGGSSFQRFPFILSARSGLYSGRRDLLRRWMFMWLRVWGCLPARVSINYPNLWIDYSKPFLKGPCHTRIEWQIRFDPVVCLAGIKDLNLLLDWTLAAVAALVLFWILVKLAVCLYGCCLCCCCLCCCCCCFCCSCCCVVTAALCVGLFAVTNVTLPALCVGFFSALFALLVGPFAVTYVTFPALYVGFYPPLRRVV